MTRVWVIEESRGSGKWKPAVLEFTVKEAKVTIRDLREHATAFFFEENLKYRVVKYVRAK